MAWELEGWKFFLGRNVIFDNSEISDCKVQSGREWNRLKWNARLYVSWRLEISDCLVPRLGKENRDSKIRSFFWCKHNPDPKLCMYRDCFHKSAFTINFRLRSRSLRLSIEPIPHCRGLVQTLQVNSSKWQRKRYSLQPFNLQNLFHQQFHRPVHRSQLTLPRHQMNSYVYAKQPCFTSNYFWQAMQENVIQSSANMRYFRQA